MHVFLDTEKKGSLGKNLKKKKSDMGFFAEKFSTSPKN